MHFENGGQAVVEMKEKFGDLAMNITVRTLAGKGCFSTTASSGDQESRQALGSFFCLVGMFMA